MKFNAKLSIIFLLILLLLCGCAEPPEIVTPSAATPAAPSMVMSSPVATPTPVFFSPYIYVVPEVGLQTGEGGLEGYEPVVIPLPSDLLRKVESILTEKNRTEVSLWLGEGAYNSASYCRAGIQIMLEKNGDPFEILYNLEGERILSRFQNGLKQTDDYPAREVCEEIIELVNQEMEKIPEKNRVKFTTIDELHDIVNVKLYATLDGPLIRDYGNAQEIIRGLQELFSSSRERYCNVNHLMGAVLVLTREDGEELIVEVDSQGYLLRINYWLMYEHLSGKSLSPLEEMAGLLGYTLEEWPPRE